MLWMSYRGQILVLKKSPILRLMNRAIGQRRSRSPLNIQYMSARDKRICLTSFPEICTKNTDKCDLETLQKYSFEIFLERGKRSFRFEGRHYFAFISEMVHFNIQTLFQLQKKLLHAKYFLDSLIRFICSPVSVPVPHHLANLRPNPFQNGPEQK